MRAQTTTTTDSTWRKNEHPRVAVVLSGGSAKGLSQIGVLQVVEQAGIPVDLVTGTSMGAIIGGLYASGYSPSALEHLATTEDWSGFFSRPMERRDRALHDKDVDQRFALTLPLAGGRPALPYGVLSRQGIAEHIEGYTWAVSADTDFTTLPTPFAALTTDLATGEAVLLRSGSLAQAMEASSAVPGAFPPVRLSSGRVVVDGAVLRNIPATDARALGADILICVDVSEHIAPVETVRSLVDVLNQTVAFRVQWSNANELPLCNVVIDPDIAGLPSVAFGQASRWIARGRVAARLHWAALLAIADSVRKTRGPVQPRRVVAAPDSIYVDRIHWTAVTAGTDGIVRGTHGLHDGTWMSLAQIQRAVTRLYSTGRFEQVSFRVVPSGEADDLWFDLTESHRNMLGVGVHYDTPRGAAVLASITVADWLSAGSDATISARLGGDQQFDVRDVLGAGPNARFTQTYQATARRTSLPQFRTIAEGSAPELDVREISGTIEGRFGTAGAAGAGVTHEWSADGVHGGGSPWIARRESFTLIGAQMRLDTYDRSLLPTRGYDMLWRSELAAHDREGATFSRHVFTLQGAHSLDDRIVLHERLDLGHGSGQTLPVDRLFFLGGSVPSVVWPTEFIPFLGVPPQSLVGADVQAFAMGVRVQFTPRVAVSIDGNTGNVFDEWPSGPRQTRYLVGGGASVIAITPIGPVSLTAGSLGRHTRPVIELSAGSVF